MMNRFGKGLVLGHTALSLLLGTWAVMIYLQFNDFGWKEPFKNWETKDSGTRVASELDKRVGALHELYRARERALPGLKPPLEALNETMDFFPKNHLFYVAELEKLRNSDNPLAPKALNWKQGDLILDTPGKNLGKPVLKGPVEGIDKSLKVYKAELKKILDDIEKITPEIAEAVKQADELTLQLFGTKDDKNASVDIGLYEILENETILQDKLKAEKEYITPVYVEAQRRFDTFRDRFGGMLKTAQPVNLKK